MTDTLIKPNNEIAVFNKKDLTISHEEVKKQDLPKYWDKNYIIDRLSMIKNYKHRMMFNFMWYTGCRVGEIISISKSDIDISNYIITIKWQKNRKYLFRNIPLHPSLKDMLQIYTAPLKMSDKVFPITRQRAWQLTQKYLDGHPHQFRHSFAVNWLRCGGDIIVLSKMLGHSKIQSTMEYLKIVPIDQGKELLKINFGRDI